MELEHRHLDRHGEGRGLAAGVQSDQGRSGALGRVGLSLHPTEAIHELLMRTPMRLVQLPNAVQETELRPKLAVKMFGVVADYVQAAALVRTVPNAATITWPPGLTERAICRTYAALSPALVRKWKTARSCQTS